MEAEQGEQRRSSSTVPAPCSNVVRAASAPMAARIGAAHLGLVSGVGLGLGLGIGLGLGLGLRLGLGLAYRSGARVAGDGVQHFPAGEAALNARARAALAPRDEE